MAAFAAARELYEQVSKGDGVKGKAEKVSGKDFQKELQRLVSDISDASDRIARATRRATRLATSSF